MMRSACTKDDNIVSDDKNESWTKISKNKESFLSSGLAGEAPSGSILWHSALPCPYFTSLLPAANRP